MTAGATPATKPEARVLVVDDETNIVELLSVSLKFQGFEVHTAANGPAASTGPRGAPRRGDPGRDDARHGRLRRAAPAPRRRDRRPALFLTARDSLQDKIAGLTLGGDDYVTKPFSLEEVVARLRVILRRAGKGVEEPRTSGCPSPTSNSTRDTHGVEGRGAGIAVADRVHAAAVLRHQCGHGTEQAQILDHVWRYDFGGDVNVVESYVSYLRRKIDTGEKRLLHTLRGVGYVLREPR